MSNISQHQLKESAIDSITGYHSRGDCFIAMRRLVSELTAERSLSIIWVALDRIKQINESFGHQGGDVVIAQITRRLRDKTRPEALWFRMAGDEFVCLVPDHDLQQIQSLASSLLNQIQHPLKLDDLLLHPSASLGIASFTTGETPSDCLERADHAMKKAKRAGGGRVIESETAFMLGRAGIHLARQELDIENKLHLSIQQGGLSLHYQPLVDADGHTVCVEALMRCQNYAISPAEFIPVAEKTGLIMRMGEWSLLEGARFAKKLSLAGYPITVAINVSRVQFSMPAFPRTLHAALLCTNVNPELIELELTESLFMDNAKVIRDNLLATQAAGVKLAIDDFGTGYSTLSILKDIPAGKLKIDRAFVIALPHDRRAFSVVKAITQLGNDLGMLVVAEGVESQAQLESLQEAGVRIIQGYIHARPMPETILLEWLKSRKTK